MTGEKMTREEIRQLCETLGFNASDVMQILIFPDHVEVTVTVPIVDR